MARVGGIAGRGTSPVFETPVVLCIFNRPDTTRRVLEVLRALEPAHLLIVADGPRANRADDARLCEETRALVRQSIDWPAEVRWDLASGNFGCRKRIQSGLDWAFDAVDAAIVLEDDCLPDLSFLAFCRELLDRYRDDTRIGMICGSNPLANGAEGPASYVFSRYPLIWGWATWRRTWALYDRDIDAWPELGAGDWLETLLDSPLASGYWRSIFASVRQGVDTWDYSLVFSLWRAGLLAIHPAVNGVTNIGFGGEATHTRLFAPFADLPRRPLAFPLAHPERIERNAAHDEALEKLMYSGTPERLLLRARDSIRRGRA